MEKKINLSQLADLMAAKSGISKQQAQEFVREFFNSISDIVLSGEQVKVRGLGLFKLIETKDRESINVNTGERFVIAGHPKLTFVPEQALKDLINRPFADYEVISLSAEQAGEISKSSASSRSSNRQKGAAASAIGAAGASAAAAVADFSTVNPTKTEEKISPEPEATEKETDTDDSGTSGLPAEEVPEITADESLKDAVQVAETEEMPHADASEAPASETGTDTETEAETEKETQTETGSGKTGDEADVSDTGSKSCPEEGAVSTEEDADRIETEPEKAQVMEPVTVETEEKTVNGSGNREEKASKDIGKNNESKKKGSKSIGLRVLLYILAFLVMLLLISYCIWPLNMLHILHVNSNKLQQKADEPMNVVQVDTNTPVENEPSEETSVSIDVSEQVSEQTTSNSGQESSSTSQVQVSQSQPTRNMPEQSRNTTQEQSSQKAPGGVQQTEAAPFDKPEKILLKLKPQDESRDVASYTIADTVNYKMTGVLTEHVLQNGQTLAQLSMKYYGSRKLWPYIAAYNGLKNPGATKVGQKLKIPVLE